MSWALCQEALGHEHGSDIYPSSSSSQSIVRFPILPWRLRQGHDSGLEVREAFTTGMTLSCSWNVFRWQRGRESFSDIRNKWAKAQIMKVRGISGKGEETEFLEHGAWSCVMLACSYWVSIPKLWISWGQARDCTLSPFKFSAPGPVPRTLSELCKFFPPSERISENKSSRVLGTNYTVGIVLSALCTSHNVKPT